MLTTAGENGQLLREVETQAIAAQQQISLVRTQQASKQREMRMAQLTRTELSTLPAETNVFEGVGKMFEALPPPPLPPPIMLERRLTGKCSWQVRGITLV